MLKFVNPDTLAPPPSNFSHVVDVPDGTRMAFISGQVGVDVDGNAADDFEGQCSRCSAISNAPLRLWAWRFPIWCA